MGALSSLRGVKSIILFLSTRAGDTDVEFSEVVELALSEGSQVVDVVLFCLPKEVLRLMISTERRSKVAMASRF